MTTMRKAFFAGLGLCVLATWLVAGSAAAYFGSMAPTDTGAADQSKAPDEAGAQTPELSAESTQAETEAPPTESTGSVESSAAAQEAPPANPRLDALLASMDARARTIKSLKADISIVSQEDIAGGRSSTRTGTIFIRKPDSIFLDLTENGYPRKIWIVKGKIVDYTPDLKSAIQVSLASDESGRPTILGLSTTSEQLRRDFDMTVEQPTEDHPGAYILTLAPKAGRRFDFTSADITLDASSLLPSAIVQKNTETGITKTYGLIRVMENARIRDAVFQPDLPGNVSIQSFSIGEWKGL